MITDRINFRQPKYVLPAILYPLLLVTGYLVMDIFDTEVAETPSALQTTEFLNPELPEAQMRDDGIGGKYESMVKSYGRIQDYSAVENIERNNNETTKEDYDSRYTEEDLALLDSEAAARSEELERLREMQEQLRQSAERGQAMVADSAGVQPLSEEERIARSEQRRKEALAELDKALAEARKQGQKGLQDMDSTGTESLAPTGSAVVGGKVEINGQAVNELAENAENEQVVKKVKTTSDYFNTLAENEPEPRLIKAIIDEDIKAVEGSLVRLRLLDDVEIDGKVVNVCPEIQAKDISGYEDAFKALCSGEGQYGRKIGGNVYVVRNVPWLIFNMNSIPKSTDGSHGFFRRFLYVVFGYIVPDELQNKRLAYDLRQEYPGILNWIMRGGKYLKQRRFIFPKSGNSEREKLVAMAESNITMSWATARGVRASAAVKNELFNWFSASDLYKDMEKYAEANGFKSVDITSFGRAMTKLGFNLGSRRRVTSGILYKVYGVSVEDLKRPVPVVQDMELTRADVLDKDVEYDEEDL